MAASVNTASDSSSGNTQITAQQLEQILKLLPMPSKNTGADTDDEMDTGYAGMVSCYLAEACNNEWIIDTGASHHMTGNIDILEQIEECRDGSKVNLPTEQTSSISHTGLVKLSNELKLNNVLYVPAFRHNLLSVKKLAQDSHCKVTFHSSFCIIQDSDTSIVKGVGKAVNGLYYLLNESIKEVLKLIKSKALEKLHGDNKGEVKAMNSELQIPAVISNITHVNPTTLWHQRLGHAPMARISKITELKDVLETNYDICVTCPLAKFTKFPFKTSNSRASNAFELVHIDTWGHYKVSTRGNHRFFNS